MKKAKYIKNYLHTIAFLLKPFYKNGGLWLSVISILLAVTILPLNTYVSVNMYQIIIDSIDAGQSLYSVLLIILIIQIIIIVTGLVEPFFSGFYVEKKKLEISAKINMLVYEKALKTDLKYFDDSQFYDKYTYAINEFSGKCLGMESLVRGLLSNLTVIVMLTTLISTTSPLLIFISVGTLLVSTWLGLKSNIIGQQKNEAFVYPNRQLGYIHSLFYTKEHAAGMKCTTVSDTMRNKYTQLIDDKKDILKKFNPKSIIYNVLTQLLFGSMNVFIMGVLVYQIIKGEISLGSFMGMMTATIYLRSYLSRFFDSYKQLHDFDLYREKIETFFKLESPIENSGGTEMSALSPYSVTIENVSFYYPQSQFGLKNLNMSIERGRKVAIVGHNGAGKSTFIKLLLRLYDPAAGQIRINDVPLTEYNLKKFRLSVGTAFQDSPVYAMSLRENMSIYGETSEEMLIDISKELELTNVMQKNNASLDTMMTREFDSSGIVLSGGEKQKLALSRVLTKSFGLIILDEPTAALDPIAEYELNKLIFDASSKSTAIIVTHRLTTAKNADYIYVFDNGEITEHGTHSDLMKEKGIYYDMFTKQAESYIE